MQNLIDNTLQQATGNIRHLRCTAKTRRSGITCLKLCTSHFTACSLCSSPCCPEFLRSLLRCWYSQLAGLLISWVLRRCLTWAKFDLRVARKSGTDWAPASSPTEIAARASFWICVLLGLVIGVSAFDDVVCYRAQRCPSLCCPI